MTTQRRVTAQGEMLAREQDDPGAWAAATQRWVPVALPSERGAWPDAVGRALGEDTGDDAGVSPDHDAEAPAASLRRVTEAALAHRPAASLPDDAVALRVPLLQLGEEEDVVRATTVTLVVVGPTSVTATSDAAALDALDERLRSLPSGRRRGGAVVARTLLVLALEQAGELSDAVSERTARWEGVVFSAGGGDVDVERLYRLKRVIADSRRHLLPVVTRLALVTDAAPDLGPGVVDHLERLEQGFRRVLEALEGDDRLLGDMLTAQLTLTQVRQNSDMRKISAYAALAAVPTAVAGIYGMNFRYMPELDWHWGYPAVLAFMAGLVLLLQRLFRRSGWL
ncbi:CorA family divalent cation transporter [Litorihabitans aurantiacus]|uniref:Magnesium transporter n=1 Tax=Litorihabitans aurantiacus TaxID=1930061 RepID=A0AA37URI9_9MICO|nr:CorA family divalent cation transporter [Litorihabitans aurantiacus]GMA31103.1 hypothetical protein GCM10025875_10950 [Litorihabitans aurantiacus]